MTKYRGHILVEVLLAMSLFVIIATAILGGFISVRDGKVAQKQTLVAKGYVDIAIEALRSVRERDWGLVASNGTFHPNLNGSVWELLPNQGPDVAGYRTQIVISDVLRASASPFGNVIPTGDLIDPASKKATITVSWGLLSRQKVELVYYLSRSTRNDVLLETSLVQFERGSNSGTRAVNNAGGEVELATNNRARWCSPSLVSAPINLPDGPPVAVAARASLISTSTPNDVFAATSPERENSIKLAYVTVSADTGEGASSDTSLKGIFTLDSSTYTPGYFPVGIGLDNSFRTNDVKYYTSSGVSSTNFFSSSANSADSGGDTNGFESNPVRAYADDASFAVDTNSGTNTTTGCTDASKDKHRFYNYNISIPSGASVTGVEVRLDAKVDSTSGSPKMCVQLSWDGGVTWTSTKSTTTLTTSEISYSLGGATDTWGRAWAASDFTNANFLLRVIDVASNTSRDFSLDWAAVRVYYSTGVGKTYALLATTKPDKEVIAVLVNDGDPSNDNTTSGEYADPAKKIFKYWTYFNTRIYNGAASNDQAPYDSSGYGAVSLAVFGDRGYVLSGGYLYVFNLTDIDTKSPSVGLDMVGCRIQLDGYDCKPGSQVFKYTAGQTGTSYGDTSSPIHSDCSDGGNIELYADNDLDIVEVGSSTYAYIAVGGVTVPELNIVNVTSVPTSSSSPTISSTSCGRTSGGNSGWKRVGILDFNADSGTEEAANSVYANATGTRAYISSNGGVDANGDHVPDSYQFYIVDTTSKTSPRFLSGTSTPPTSGYYYGQGTTDNNKQLYPHRSLTVLNGDRAVLVGKDGVSDTNDAQEYQVLNMETHGEDSPIYCGGVNYNSGFNDLVSVVEADNDSIVYMVANTEEKQLKIIQGGEDGTYVATGVFDSKVFDAVVNGGAGLNGTVMFNRLDADVSIPSGTALDFQVATYGDGTEACSALPSPIDYYGPDGTKDTSFTVGGPIPYFNLPIGNTNPARCLKYKVSLYADTSRDKTPVLNSMTVNYSL